MFYKFIFHLTIVLIEILSYMRKTKDVRNREYKSTEIHSK